MTPRWALGTVLGTKTRAMTCCTRATLDTEPSPRTVARAQRRTMAQPLALQHRALDLMLARFARSPHCGTGTTHYGALAALALLPSGVLLLLHYAMPAPTLDRFRADAALMPHSTEDTLFTPPRWLRHLGTEGQGSWAVSTSLTDTPAPPMAHESHRETSVGSAGQSLAFDAQRGA